MASTKITWKQAKEVKRRGRVATFNMISEGLGAHAEMVAPLFKDPNFRFVKGRRYRLEFVSITHTRNSGWHVVVDTRI